MASVTFAVASAAYRVFVVVAILWFLEPMLKPYGLEMLARLIGMVVIRSDDCRAGGFACPFGFGIGRGVNL